MSDIALNYSGQSGDLDLTGHRLNLITDEAAIEQQVRIRCLFFYESWFLDLRQGIPYFLNVYIKNPNLDLVRSLFRTAILGTPRISTVPTIELTLDKSTRALTISFTATMDTGELLVFSPFIVEI
jgi:hypothetical protein